MSPLPLLAFVDLLSTGGSFRWRSTHEAKIREQLKIQGVPQARARRQGDKGVPQARARSQGYKGAPNGQGEGIVKTALANCFSMLPAEVFSQDFKNFRTVIHKGWKLYRRGKSHLRGGYRRNSKILCSESREGNFVNLPKNYGCKFLKENCGLFRFCVTKSL